MSVPHVHKQAGFTTILISLLLLLITTAVTITVSKYTVSETVLSADDARRIEAYDNAMQGFYVGVNFIQSHTAASSFNAHVDDVDGVLRPASKYKVWLCDAESDPLLNANKDGCEKDAEFKTGDTRTAIFSHGWSDDSTANHYILAGVAYSKYIPDPPEAPVIGANLVDVSGNATLTNPSGRVTIWSGTSVEVGQGSGSGAGTLTTQILSPANSYSDYVASLEEGGSPTTTVAGSSGGVKGVDVIEGDSNIASLEPKALFAAFFGDYSLKDGGNYLETDEQANGGAGYEIDELRGYALGFDAEIYNSAADFLANLTPSENSKNPRVIYVDANEGEVELPKNTVLTGPDGSDIILLIDGWLDVAGNTDFNGLLFVTGDLEVNGTGSDDAKFEGAVIVAGKTLLNGKANFTFDAIGLSNLGNETKINILPGGWRDWR